MATLSPHTTWGQPQNEKSWSDKSISARGPCKAAGLKVTTWLRGRDLYKKNLLIKIQGPLADMDLSLPDFSFCGWPQGVWELSVATIMNLAWIQRYQMKDMDILFPLVPYNPILSKWLGHSDLAKLGVFWCFSWFPRALKICIQILIFKFTPFKDGAI